MSLVNYLYAAETKVDWTLTQDICIRRPLILTWAISYSLDHGGVWWTLPHGGMGDTPLWLAKEEPALSTCSVSQWPEKRFDLTATDETDSMY